MRNRRPSLRLVVVVDADEDDPAILRRQHTGPDSTVAGVFPDVADIVAVFLPKRNIETWIRFLEGDPYDEETKYPKKYRGCERKCIDGVRELDRHCESRRFPSAPPPSLARACEEFDRVLRS